ncbi:MAG: dephospho-CoA kinase [Planctomycetaceae bacterium]|jgi:dephospho-CoA kinase|nr:dephospho-CoA kinase [Planctomycetaceae bacterium]
MQTLGLIGGIASGKSTVARMFQQLGVVRIDADQLAHLALELPEIKAAVRERWGGAVFDADGNPDRRKIAAAVFEPSEKSRQELVFLQKLIHPVVGAGVAARLKKAETEKVPLVLLDAPLLLEAGWEGLVDKIVFVDAPLPVRLSRAAARGWSEQEFIARERNQLPVEKKRIHADVVIGNSGTEDETLEQVRHFFKGVNR